MEQEETPGKKACCGRGCPRGKLHSFNYLDDVPGAMAECNIVEVQFKNTRKGYYVNSLNLPVEKGDMVAVESADEKGRVETRYGIETPFSHGKACGY